jgi:Bacterial Ig-like domain (group 3)
MSVLSAISRPRFSRPRLLPASFVVLFCFAMFGRAQSVSTDIQVTGRVEQPSNSRLGVNLSTATETEAFASAEAQTNAEPGAQTTVMISNTVETTGIDRPGINLGGNGNYGSQQLLKSLNYANGGYMPGTYFGLTDLCSNGGNNTTTTWYNNTTDSSGFPANFWVGASFVSINASNGTSYGSGTITASTSNVSAGTTFTLSPAISSACNPSDNDVLIVRQTAANTLLTPSEVINSVCSGASWDTSDTSPSSSNTRQSLEMPTGCLLAYYMDAVLPNRTNTTSTLAAQQVNFINLNGSYNATFKAKCLVSGCSINFNLGRFGGPSYIGSTTVNPGFSSTPGTGWTTYDYPFTASETGTQSSTLGYSFTCTGTCLMQDTDVVEGSTLAGNTTPFRDAVVWELEQIHPGSIRYMDNGLWCSDVADEIASTGNRRWCGHSSYLPQVGWPAMGYNDVLALGNVVGTDVLITVGQLNGPSDWTTLINWLSSSGWISTYAASGHKIYLEDGNEAWNPGAGCSLYTGDGTAYGYTLGPNMAAAKAASGYNSSVIKLVGNSWVAANQGYGPYGWIHNMLTTASGTTNGLPNYVDVAPYMLNYLGSFATSGSNVSTTGAPFLDEWAEEANLDSVTSPSGNPTSMYENVQYAQSNFSVGTVVYEVNESALNGITASQSQLNQISGSVGNALSTMEHVLLMQRDSGVTGPIHVFTLADPYSGYTCSGCGTLDTPLWGANILMATGPGQTAGSANVDRPLAIAERVINNAIGSNNNLLTTSQSGTPTFSYTANQDQSGTPTIPANSQVPYVNCFAYTNNAQTNWTTICFNNNLSSTESVSFTGAGAPSGTVTETLFGNNNLITDSNENTYLGPFSIAPVVNYPSSTTTSGSSYTIPAASMMVLAYGSGNPPVLPAPTSTTTLQASPTSANTGQSVTLTATVTSQSGTTTPTGTVTFYNRSSSLGTASLGSTGIVTFSATTLPAGSDSITAFYGGDANDASSTSPPVTVTVTSAVVPTNTVLATSATAINSGQSVTFTATVSPQSGSNVPTGTVTFLDRTTTLGTGTLNASGVATFRLSSLSVGTQSITALYGGDSKDNSSVSNAVSVVVTQTAVATTTRLTASAIQITIGQSVAFTAKVVPQSGKGVPTGSIKFFDGTQSLGKASLNAGGTATLSTTALAAGRHSITASYFGEGGDSSSVSNAISVVVTQRVLSPPPSFSTTQ